MVVLWINNMKRMLMFMLAVGFVWFFSTLSPVVAVAPGGTCTSSNYCNCPCGELCYEPQNCSCVSQYCDTTTTCGSNISGSSCPPDYKDQYGGCSAPPDYCVTNTSNCHEQTNTYSCPGFISPCVNPCSAPTPTVATTPPPTCPNGTCNAGESCANCPADCGGCPVTGSTPTPPPSGTCGNGICGGGESCDNCSADCGACPGISCNPDLWGAWSSCSGSPATKSRTNECGNPQTTNCTGSIQARAVIVSSADTSCAAVRASTNGINGSVHQFTAGSASQPAPQTQSGSSYVSFFGLVGGTYTITPTVPADYILSRACWTKLLNSPTSGEGLTVNLSVPTDADGITWDIGYIAGNPWVQTGGGGNVYGAGAVSSHVPSATSPRVFALDGSGGTPGLVTYGTSYDFDSDPLLTGESYVSSTNWLANETYAAINYYDLFYRRFGGPTTADSFVDLGAVTKPASRTTPYYVVGDMTTSGDWTVGNGETVIFIVNGNLTLGGKVNLTGSGFAAFIVNGNITVASSVGGLYTSSLPAIEGIYVTSPSGTFSTSTSSVSGKERLVGQGIFVAGSFLLQRDLESITQNNTTAAELFLYNPRLLIAMPDSMRDVPITWEEVAP